MIWVIVYSSVAAWNIYIIVNIPSATIWNWIAAGIMIGMAIRSAIKR